jgi:hypothetical protein
VVDLLSGGQLCKFFGRSRRAKRFAPQGAGYVRVAIPTGIDWPVHRLLTCGRYQVRLEDLEDRWSMDDLQDALDMVEALEEAESRAAAYAKASARSKQSK